MRNRLIELLTDSEINYAQYLYKECDKTIKGDIEKQLMKRLEFYADSLLANGVIAPPCKVGDTIYMPWKWNDTKGIAVLTVTHIIIDGLKAYIKTDFHTDDEDYYNTYNCGRFNFDEFGKIVFTRIEEAEQALKGGN